MFGVNVEAEPLIVLSVLVVDPVTDDCELEADPLIDGGFTVTLPVDGEIVGALVVPLTTPELLVPVLAFASLSGMQSIWTGLAEWSLAWPVSLPASLPACGFLKLLHSGLVGAVGLDVVLHVVGAAAVVGTAFDVLSETARLGVCSRTGAAP